MTRRLIGRRGFGRRGRRLGELGDVVRLDEPVVERGVLLRQQHRLVGTALLVDVTEVDAGEGSGHDGSHPGFLQANDGLLSRTAATPVLARDDNVPRLDVLDKVGIQVFQGVLRHFFAVENAIGILAGKDHVSIHIVAIFPHPAFDDGGHARLTLH